MLPFLSSLGSLFVIAAIGVFLLIFVVVALITYFQERSRRDASPDPADGGPPEA